MDERNKAVQRQARNAPHEESRGLTRAHPGAIRRLVQERITRAPDAVSSGVLFQCDPDIRLARSEIFLDPSDPRPIGIISHAHGDHIAAHDRYVATPATASFLRARLGAELRGVELRGVELGYGEPHAIGGWTVSLHPAGHILVRNDLFSAARYAGSTDLSSVVVPRLKPGPTICRRLRRLGAHLS